MGLRSSFIKLLHYNELQLSALFYAVHIFIMGKIINL